MVTHIHNLMPWTAAPLSQGNSSAVSIDGKEVAPSVKTTVQNGFVGMGTGGFYSGQFDDFYIIEGQ